MSLYLKSYIKDVRDALEAIQLAHSSVDLTGHELFLSKHKGAFIKAVEERLDYGLGVVIGEKIRPAKKPTAQGETWRKRAYLATEEQMEAVLNRLNTLERIVESETIVP